MSKKTHLPIPVQKGLKRLGKNISDARRRIAMELMSERSGFSRVTLSKIEKGDPSVSMGAYASALFVLGMSDHLARVADGRPYLTPKDKESIPPLIDLPRLLSATERYLNDDETAEDLKILLAPGSSLGGARPKASVRDKDSHLAIAKFAKKDDEFNVVVWEAVALTLAEKAGVKFEGGIPKIKSH